MEKRFEGIPKRIFRFFVVLFQTPIRAIRHQLVDEKLTTGMQESENQFRPACREAGITRPIHAQPARTVVGIAADRLARRRPPLGRDPEDRGEHVRRLLELATQDPAEIGAGRTAAGDITEFVYRSFSVTTRPFVRLTTHWIPLSQNLVLEKFLAAIPHLLDESHRAAGGKNIEGTRGPFGYLLEGYLSSLFHGWFDAHPDIRGLTNYHYRDGQDTPEADILLLTGSTAFVFEVKAKVATRVLRSEGMFGPISALLLPSAKQTLRVADAVLRGDALHSDGTPITGITRVYPCSVVYDRVPLRPPISDRYESHLEKEIGRAVFNTGGAVMPLQFFDLETIEGWEDYLNLTPPANEVLAYLHTRSVTPWLRHGRQFPDSSAPRPRTAHGPHQRWVEASQEYFSALAEEAGLNGQRAAE